MDLAARSGLQNRQKKLLRSSCGKNSARTALCYRLGWKHRRGWQRPSSVRTRKQGPIAEIGKRISLRSSVMTPDASRVRRQLTVSLVGSTRSRPSRYSCISWPDWMFNFHPHLLVDGGCRGAREVPRLSTVLARVGRQSVGKRAVNQLLDQLAVIGADRAGRLAHVDGGELLLG